MPGIIDNLYFIYDKYSNKEDETVCKLIFHSFICLYFTGWFIKSPNEAANISPQHNVKKAFLDELKAENIKTFL